MRSIQEIESIIDSLPEPKVSRVTQKPPRRKPVWRTLMILGVSLSVMIIALLVLSGMVQFLVVLSGSMQPTFQTGDVIVTVDTPVSSLQVNDVITYHSPENTKMLVTHRIMKKTFTDHGFVFLTKGDANDMNDSYQVSSDLVVGRIVCSIPYVGYVAQVSHSVFGFLLLVLAPGVVVICGEVVSIVRKVKERQD